MGYYSEKRRKKQFYFLHTGVRSEKNIFQLLFPTAWCIIYFRKINLGLAKFGIALGLGPRDRGFESRSPDQKEGTPMGCPLSGSGEGIRTHRNATVRWTVACRRFNGGNTINLIESRSPDSQKMVTVSREACHSAKRNDNRIPQPNGWDSEPNVRNPIARQEDTTIKTSRFSVGKPAGLHNCIIEICLSLKTPCVCSQKSKPAYFLAFSRTVTTECVVSRA